MARLLPLAHVRLLAAGTLPDRPMSRPVVPPGDGSGAGRLINWRRLQAVSERTPIAIQHFDEDAPPPTGPQRNLHASRLRDHWTHLCQAVDAPMLVYLHRGHQTETHSPILQHLLQLLDYRGPVHALRVETRDDFRDAMVMARALAAKSNLALVLRDPTERLTTRSSPQRRMRFALLGTEAPSPEIAPVPVRPDPSVSFFLKRF